LGLFIHFHPGKPLFFFPFHHTVISIFFETMSVNPTHNAPFDMGVLYAVLEWYELKTPALQYFCTCSLARRTWPGLESFALSDLAENFGIVYNAHNALDDAMTCGKLVLMSAEKHSSANVAKLLEAAGVKMGALG
jgi:DNA polymerase-3 subunit epsilon